MKRTATALALAFAAAALLTGASVWEGAAVTAAAGELPESGNYVATNAFPRNTVVDVKNLENDKTVRAVVSGGLDSPGLLASLSREAADAIGMNSRDIGRVRMTMPADPIAFARFNEGFESSGDPDHDPQAAIAAAAMPSEALPPGPTTPAEVVGAQAAPAVPAEAAADEAVAEETPVDLVDATEETEEVDSEEVAALPAEEAASEDTAVAEESPNGEEAPPVAEMPPVEDEVAAVPVPVEGEAPAAEEIAEADASTMESEAAPAEPDVAPGSEEVDLALVPAEERPPLSAGEAMLPAGAEVAPIGETAVIPEPIPTLPTEVDTPTEVGARPEGEVAVVDPSGAISSRDLPSSGAPVISDLERGKYYLQLGAFGKAEAVEAEIAKHGKAFPLAIQSAGSVDKPVYRVLVGPVNLGESGALLQRFKRSGYRDAFVKQGS